MSFVACSEIFGISISLGSGPRLIARVHTGVVRCTSHRGQIIISLDYFDYDSWCNCKSIRVSSAPNRESSISILDSQL